MGEPVNLSEKRAQRDGAGFIDCPTCGADHDGTDWVVACRFNGEKPFIAALICTECATELVIEFGNIVEVKPHAR